MRSLRTAAPLVMVLFVAYCQGCERPATHPAYCTDEAAFTARLLACVDESSRLAKDEESFRAQSRVCRVAVHERCGIATVGARDGGAP